MMSPRTVLVSLALALVVSLSANAFMGGLLLGRPQGDMPPPPIGLMDMPQSRDHDDKDHDDKTHGDKEHDDKDRAEKGHFRDGMKKFLKDLPDDVSAPLAQTLKDSRPIMEDGVAKLKEGNAQITALIQAEPFNADALKDALARQRDRQKEMQAAIHAKIVDTLSTLTPDQRALLAKNPRQLFR